MKSKLISAIKTKTLLAVLGLLIAAGSQSSAFASSNEYNDNHKDKYDSKPAITMTEAVKIAEENSGGVAKESEYEQGRFEVELVKADTNREIKVYIDGQTGEIISKNRKESHND